MAAEQPPPLPPVLFIHGFKGGTLVDRTTGREEWLTAWKAISRTSPPRVALPLQWDQNGAVQQRDNLVPGEPIWRVSGIVDVYASFMAWGRRHCAAEGFSAFVYDWRRDIAEASRALLATLRSLPSPPLIVAHSMGGLVAYGALAMAEEASALVHSILFAGTPFAPWNAFLEDLTPGTPRHPHYLNSRTSFTFTSIYSLFPVQAGEALGDAQTWIDRNLGLFSVASEPRTPERVQHLTNALGRAKRFRNLLSTPLREQILVPVAVLASHAHKTPSGFDIRQDPPRTAAEWRAIAHEPGDGRVPFESAVHLPPGFGSEAAPMLFLSKNIHSEILSDTAIVAKALRALAEARRVL